MCQYILPERGKSDSSGLAGMRIAEETLFLLHFDSLLPREVPQHAIHVGLGIEE